ncbi:DUF2809 domain-containing protein [Emticicia sp. SJ17W-69]|uniref:ribosomal maturation YjgA family protein n=1 Tax=Emticicia sp. SJ17W-69 TaxID=3421657 RepID=UPI003EC0A9F6
MFTFNLKPFIIFLLLFLTEVMIAIFMHDAIIRPIFGDFLAVITLYYLLKSFLTFNNLSLILGSLCFAYLLEFLQYIDFLTFTGLKDYKIIAVVLGTSFSWGDIVAYTFGALFIMLSEKQLKNQIIQKIF